MGIHTPSLTHAHTNAYNLESIAATDFNLGVMILTSSCYTGKEFRAKSTSSLGGASARVNHVQKLPFYASLWQLSDQYRRLIIVSNVNCLQTKWGGFVYPGMVTNLRTAKNHALRNMVLFLIFYHI